ncbi:hypothetical protein F3157_08180 [Virgibacillus dakarensis]|nr:hypothetical protein [Virgibacillus dakarensis]
MDTSLKIKDANSDFFTIIAIQIGFNITSLALISAFNKDALRNIFSKIKDSGEKEKALRQLLASFIYCVFIQTGVIVAGFFYNINIEDLYNIEYIKQMNGMFLKCTVLGLYSIWMWVIFHTFMVSVRNVVLIYKFILVVFRG